MYELKSEEARIHFDRAMQSVRRGSKPESVLKHLRRVMRAEGDFLVGQALSEKEN